MELIQTCQIKIYPLEHAIRIKWLEYASALINSNKIDFSIRLNQINNNKDNQDNNGPYSNSKSAQPNKGNNTYLHLATCVGCEKILSLLLSNKLIDINAEDSLGETPLIEACRNKNTESINLLFSMPDLDYKHCNKRGDDALRISEKICFCNDKKWPKNKQEYQVCLLDVINNKGKGTRFGIGTTSIIAFNANENENKTNETKEKEQMEKETKESEDKANETKETKEKEQMEKETKECERKENENKESENKVNITNEKEKMETETKENETKESESKENTAKENEDKANETKETKETKESESKTKEDKTNETKENKTNEKDQMENENKENENKANATKENENNKDKSMQATKSNDENSSTQPKSIQPKGWNYLFTSHKSNHANETKTLNSKQNSDQTSNANLLFFTQNPNLINDSPNNCESKRKRNWNLLSNPPKTKTDQENDTKSLVTNQTQVWKSLPMKEKTDKLDSIQNPNQLTTTLPLNSNEKADQVDEIKPSDSSQTKSCKSLNSTQKTGQVDNTKSLNSNEKTDQADEIKPSDSSKTKSCKSFLSTQKTDQADNTKSLNSNEKTDQADAIEHFNSTQTTNCKFLPSTRKNDQPSVSILSSTPNPQTESKKEDSSSSQNSTLENPSTNDISAIQDEIIASICDSLPSVTPDEVQKISTKLSSI